MGQMELTMLDTIYTEAVEAIVIVPVWKEQEFSKKVTEATAGKAIWEELDEMYFAKINGEIVEL